VDRRIIYVKAKVEEEMGEKSSGRRLIVRSSET